MSLAYIIVLDSFFPILILEQEAILADFLNNFFFLINFDYLAVHFLLEGIVAHFSDESDLLRQNILLELTFFSQLIHDFEHVVLEAQGSISLSLKVDLDELAVTFHVDPSDVALINIYFIV